MIDVNQTKQKIISFLESEGPVLPVKISRKIEMSSMFSSAILAELLNEKRIKTSNMLIGSSPLYMLPGQEPQLENFIDEITGSKKEALLKLKQNKILKDQDQEPVIRAALRSIKDFAIPLKINNEIYWKYFTISNEEINNIITKRPKEEETQKEETKSEKHQVEENQEEDKKTPKKKPKQIESPKEEKPKEETKSEKHQVEENQEEDKKTKKQTQKEEFLEEIKNFLIKKDIELFEEIESSKKEILAKIRINSDLGKLMFLLFAKDKKRPNEADLTMAYQKAINKKMPCLFISRGKPSKKTDEFIKKHKDLLKLDFLE